MTTIRFDLAAFQTLFPEFANDNSLQAWWDTATAYINDQYFGCWTKAMTLAQQTLALNQMTAHLAWLSKQIATGGSPGFVQQATIDKISVTLQAPPEANQWQWWLNQSPYGQQLLALLTLAGVGGNYYGGYPIAPAFRR